MNQKNGNNTRLTICITILMIVSTMMLDRLIPEGMFLDGITYAAIARNLAIGKGNFWELYYRGNWFFSEHPPLMLGLEAIFFKIFGDHYWVEKLYSFIIWLTSLFLIRYFWNWIVSNKKIKYTFVLPVLLWSIAPTVTWGYANNILDCTMAMFDLLAVILLTQASAKTTRKSSLYFISGALFTFAALLTKGPVGAFPLAIPGIYWLVYSTKTGKTFGKVLLQTLLVAGIVVCCFIVLYQFPGPQGNFNRYLDEQLMAALHGKREITGGLGRFNIIFYLVIQLIPTLGLGLILLLITRLSKAFSSSPTQPTNKKHILFFLLVGISASLPIMMSVKQRTFYLVPSLPYYIIALSLWILPVYVKVTGRLRISLKGSRHFKMIAGVVSIILCIYLGSKIGQVGRNKELISNIKYLATQFPKGQVLGICPESERNYEFLAYLERYNRMEVTADFYCAEYVLIDKTTCDNNIIPVITQLGYIHQPFGLDKYELYKRRMPLNFDFTLLNPAFQIKDK